MNRRNFIWAIMSIFCSCCLNARSVKNVECLFSRTNTIEVTRIDYDKNKTTVYFAVFGKSGNFRVGSSICAVGDGGVECKIIGTKGIRLDSVYNMAESEPMKFSIDFEPLPVSNSCLDIRTIGRLAFYGLHEKGQTPPIPEIQCHYDGSERQEELYRTNDVEIEGILHDSLGILGKQVYVNRMPLIIKKGVYDNQFASVDDNGHFSIRYKMDVPQIVYLRQDRLTGTGISPSFIVRPGDHLMVEIYASDDTHPFEIENLSGRNTYSRSAASPAMLFNFLPYLDNRIAGFKDYTYEQTMSDVKAGMKKELEFAKYVCWHYGLTPSESQRYVDNIILEYVSFLIYTDISVQNHYLRANGDETKQRPYASIIEKADYSYLRLLSPDVPEYIIANSNGEELGGIIIQLKPFDDCFKQIGIGEPDRWIRIVKMQQKILSSLTGWDDTNFIMDEIIVAGMNQIFTDKAITKEEADAVRQLLKYPYGRQCFDIYYADYASKQAK